MVCLLLSSCGFASPQTFPQAKKIAGEIFANHQETLYCHCQYNAKKQVNLDGCGMSSANPIKRAHRIEWEHMMAAEHFGHHFKCWREPLCEKKGKRYKGRACCEQIDAEFRHLESELYNLWPSVGLVNQARSNYRFSALEGQKSFFGCDILIDKSIRRVEPPNHAKGIVARAHLFIAEHYGIALSGAQQKLFESWNAQYPPDAWEREWAQRVATIEGYENLYITQWHAGLPKNVNL